jgi:hypothetical protein
MLRRRSSSRKTTSVETEVERELAEELVCAMTYVS